MGVSGTGKSTIAAALRELLRWDFCEGDDLHPQSNIDKMSRGEALDDEDRWPWLEALVDWTAERERGDRDTILTCSALKRSYRDVLRRGGPGTYFVHLVGDDELLAGRMSVRERHFMPTSLLDSQLETLEHLEKDERGMIVDVVQDPESIARMIVAQVGAVGQRQRS
ncbi:gluconokinase [Ornithinimicrobium avium]|uniref:Gluconokinase n=2 Tax=Ornithinimicrobium avium TaxID=2283195 RepID=A0A345NSL2_9MICO|nr:gluconokinase [Ornithinimicrobium avium]